FCFFFFQAEDGIRDGHVTGVQTCALPISLFDIILLNLRERNAASGGEEMLRLRVYEKLQGLVGQGAVNRTVNGTTKKYKGVAPRMRGLKAEMKILRADWAKKLRAKAAARR